MPVTAYGNPQSMPLVTAMAQHQYQYPEGLDLRPGSAIHQRLLTMIMEKANASMRKMSVRHGAWRDIDHTLTAYIPTDEAEKAVKDKDSRKPISIVFPYSYTVLETLLSYFTSAFIQDPIFRYEGSTPDSVVGSILLEKIIYQQCVKNKVGLNLHTFARDGFAYGFGVATPTWEQEYGDKYVTEMRGGFLGYGAKPTKYKLTNQLTFEGNALENIDPYLYLPDPSAPIHEPQKGSFVGWVTPSNYMNLLSEEGNGSSGMFNVKYLEQFKGKRSSLFMSDNSGRGTKQGLTLRDSPYGCDTDQVDIVKMFIKLIPKQWGLGTGEYPETWYFELAGDAVLIKAQRSNLAHKKFPISVIAPDFDGYSLSPISRMEMLYGMQGVLDFLFNSHVANVRKAINDMIIYDPYQVNSEDLSNPEPGKLIRLRRPAWGRGVKDVAMQLGVTDVTRANVQDSAWIIQWMDRISGADSSMQGAIRQGGPERLTGAEFQGTRSGGIARMERMAKLIGEQGLQDIGRFFALHNKQFMTMPAWVKYTGDWEQVLLAEYGQQGIDRGKIKVDPQDVDVNFDVMVRDGSVPGGNYSGDWLQLFQIIGGNQGLAQQFDMVRIFKHIARNLGAKDVNEFVMKGGVMQPTQMPDEQVLQQAQAGNLMPVSELGGLQ